MFHYLVTFKTSIQAYNSAPFFGQRRCDSRGRAKIAKVYGARDLFPIPLYIISGVCVCVCVCVRVCVCVCDCARVCGMGGRGS